MNTESNTLNNEVYKKEFINIIYDTLMGNKNLPQLKLHKVKNQFIDNQKIEMEYELNEIFRKNSTIPVDPKELKIIINFKIDVL